MQQGKWIFQHSTPLSASRASGNLLKRTPRLGAGTISPALDPAIWVTQISRFTFPDINLINHSTQSKVLYIA
ncbi:hypothetical protein A3860_27895 [Niastella vici]|uniref:Uncharacterized protein n=1 Tax=Niastella vici TaxID=1703345 RepID=A0A1V9FW43_9BACT|nr:hypothetical protein A3860_27895 [Niastella vici]